MQDTVHIDTLRVWKEHLGQGGDTFVWLFLKYDKRHEPYWDYSFHPVWLKISSGLLKLGLLLLQKAAVSKITQFWEGRLLSFFRSVQKSPSRHSSAKKHPPFWKCFNFFPDHYISRIPCVSSWCSACAAFWFHFDCLPREAGDPSPSGIAELFTLPVRVIISTSG